MTNKQVARVLRETGALIELTGGNAFRARAYQNASRIVERVEEPLTDLVARSELTTVGGIGAAMAAQIEELLTRGSFEMLDDLLASIPAGLVEILRIKGIGAKKARTLWQDLNITTVEELEAAARAGAVASLPGFGTRTQETILANLSTFLSYRGFRRYAEAHALAAPLLEAMEKLELVAAASTTGDLRRRMEVVSSADFVVAASDVDAAARRLQEVLPLLDSVASDGEQLLTGVTPDGLALRVHVVPSERYGTVLWRTTGSAEHCEMFEKQYGPPPHAESEASIFASAGIAFVEPELRENRGELDAAAQGALPDLIRVEDLRGVLHNHSTYSDGTHTLRQMAEAVRDRGLSYFGICDHSKSLTVANGLPVERVRQQQDEIRHLNDEFASDGGPAFRIFSGIESDVLPDGSLDYPEEVLASFDFVVASVHSRFNMSESEATDRLIEAVRNPYTTILGHATGRLLLARSGYPIDHEAVIAACADTGTVIEINANPRRLDMDWRWIRRATGQGVLISINPDAHSIQELDYVRWGVAVARKAWLTPGQCLNARSLDDLARWFEERRTSRIGRVS